MQVPDAPVASRRREVLTFFTLAAFIWPFIAVGVVATWGLVVWIYQILTGPPGNGQTLHSSSRRGLITGRLAECQPAASFSHLVSLVVHARPAELGSIRSVLAEMPGVEIHAENALGKIVITLETADEHEIVQRMGAIGELPGVLSTALVFQHSDPNQET
jgi:nitrate reductase NapD